MGSDPRRLILSAWVLWGAAAWAAPPPAPRAHPGGDVYVSVRLDPRESPGELRDAVADLSRSASFRPDPAAAAAAARGWVSGWLPSSGLADAARSRAVSRLEVSYGKAAPPERGPEGRFLVDIRVRPGETPADAFSRVGGDLELAAGARWLGAVSVRHPGGSTATVLTAAGELPVERLSTALAHSDVLGIEPLPPEPEPVAAAPPPPPPEPRRAGGLLSYAMARAPLLMLLTGFAAATLVPAFSGLLRRLAQFFIPYR